MFDRLDELLAPTGLFVRGGFHPAGADGVPDLPNGKRPKTVALVGNAGTAMWDAFVASCASGRNPLDGWLRPIIEGVAAETGAAVVFPADGPPYPPVQDWAARAESVYRSPTGIMIHPEFGLWHVYRAALMFEDRLALPRRQHLANPCDACERKPCLDVCPADAFLPDRFDVPACVSHVDGPEGGNCRNRGCMARRACPVGKKYRYAPEQQAYHMDAMLRMAKRLLSGESSRTSA